MATYFTDDFSGYADGTLLTAGRFERVYPSGAIVAGLEAVYNTNRAVAGTSGSEKLYRSLDAPNGVSDFVAKVKLTWANAGTQGRKAGLAVRLSGDGQAAYVAVLDSNTGLPRLYLYRRAAGVMTSIGGGPISISETPSQLNAGVTLKIRVKNDAATGNVTLKVWVETSLYFDLTDSDASRVESGPTVGLYFDSASVSNDVAYDDLSTEDFESEFAGSPLSSGISLVINGVYYDEAAWREANIAVLKAVETYQPAGAVAYLADLNDAHEPVLTPGTRIKVILDGVTLCNGYLRQLDQDFNPPEGNAYEVVGAHELAGEVPIEDPDTGAGVVAFNQEADSELYVASRADKKIGEMIAFLLDNHVDGEDGLRIRGAAPASGSAYVSSELTGLDSKTPHVTVTGTVLQAIESLLSFMPEYAVWIDPDTLVWHFHKRSDGALTDIDFAAGLHTLASIRTDPTKNRTAVIIRGTKPDAQDQTFKWDSADPTNPNGLQRAWDTSLESKIQESKRFLQEHGTEVTGSGTSGGTLYVDVKTTPSNAFSMEANEWRGAGLVFYGGPQAGNLYHVKSNTTGRVTLRETAWAGVGSPPPIVGDACALISLEDAGGLPNGFDDVGSAWKLPGNQRVAGGLCGDLTVTQKEQDASGAWKTVTYKSRLRKQLYADPDTGEQQERLKAEGAGFGILDGYFKKIPNLCAADALGNINLMTNVEVTLKVFDPTVDKAPKLRRPATGFTGTAFSFDETRWGTTKGPATGDVGVMTPLVIEDQNYTDPTLQDAEYTKFADSVLAVLGTLAREAEILRAGLDTTFAGLNKRLRLKDTGNRTTGFESATDLWLLAVEYDFVREETKLTCGTMSGGSFNIDAYRQRFAEKTRLDALKEQRRRLEELYNCLRNNLDGGVGAVGADSPRATPGCRVSVDVGGTHKTLQDFVDQTHLEDCNVTYQTRGCVGVVCNTISGENNFDANASNIAGAFNSASMGNLMALLCGLAAHVANIWTVFGGIGVSHDVELNKAKIDLGNVRVAGTNLAQCVNDNFNALCAKIDALNAAVACIISWINNTMRPAYNTCFAAKVNGGGTGCDPGALTCTPLTDCVYSTCVFDFTEHVCEAACQQTVPAVAF